MKLIIAAILFTISTTIQARMEKVQFSESMLKSFNEEVKKDDEAFKKPIAPSRAPASVAPVQEVEKPADKMERNLNQMGSSKW